MVLIIAEGITDCHQWSTTGLVVPLRATTVLTMILMTRAAKDILMAKDIMGQEGVPPQGTCEEALDTIGSPFIKVIIDFMIRSQQF